MTLKLVAVEAGQISYLPGEEFTLQLRFDAPSEELAFVRNVSVNLFRVEKERNQFAFGFGSKPKISGNVLTVTQKLAGELMPGLYVVGAATLCRGDELHNNLTVRFDSIFFAIRSNDKSPLDHLALSKKIADISEARQAHSQNEILTAASAASSSSKAFRVLILGVGCLLHAPQPLEGFTIYPLGRGFSYGRMLEIANHAFRNSGIKQISVDPQTELQHEQATPTFMIDYWRVVGVDHEDALNHCRNHADLIFDLLGLDRGQKPREFYCVALDHATGERWHNFSVPWYRGNLISDFNPVATANLIQAVTPRLQKDPFLRLLVRSYAEATAEDDPGIGLLRAWTVLELLADRTIPRGQPIAHPDGVPIVNPKGNAKDTNAKEARVYELVRRSNAGFPSHMVTNVDGVERRFLMGADESHAGYTPATRLIPLWDVVRSAYAIRNCVAHEGYFSEDAIDTAEPDQVLAADLIKNTPLDPRRWVRDQAHLAVLRELHKK